MGPAAQPLFRQTLLGEDARERVDHVARDEAALRQGARGEGVRRGSGRGGVPRLDALGEERGDDAGEDVARAGRGAGAGDRRHDEHAVAGRGAERFGCVCLLKGADTIVAAPGPGASAGTGDVLTGVVAAFLAKGLEPRYAAAAGATAHALAARTLPQRGLVAGDVVDALPRVLS